jgi:CheY-like chemotaxis protein/HPt (histidine-containing phosphotransfer) domain-containing protein
MGPENPFELVLMDWKMPGLDGIETARRIKGHAALKHAPTIIMVTAHGREEVMKEAEEAGLDGFLIKPVSPSVLFNTIIAALGGGEGKTPEPATETVISEQITARIQGARVLVVEDNEINQQVAREILENAGLRVSVADNGQTALEKLEHGLFHAVLMDIQMPIMDGFAATDAIRKSPLHKSIPVIAMTAHAMTGDREKGLAAGMDDYVTKPVDPENLIQTLAKWIHIENRSEHDAIRRATRPQPHVELPDTLDGIDMETGLIRMGENQQLFRNLLVKFRTDYAGVASELANLLKSENLEDARRLAHTIKSVAGNLGAEALAGAAGNLETAISLEDADELPRAIDTFTRELKRVVTALQDVKAPPEGVQSVVKTTKGDASGTSPATPAHLSALLELEPHARARRPKPCAESLERITLLTWPEHLAPEVDQMVKKIQKYRYKEALEILDRLKERLPE